MGTYREKEVDNIHQDKNQVAHACVAVPVRGENKGICHDVVGEHLPVVLPALFDVDDNDLLHPERELSKHVPLHNTRNLPDRPAGPQLVEIEVVWGVAVDVLEEIVSLM